MRLCKGDFVEVLRKKEVPTGSWHCAEVISGNGHTYTVKYVRFHWTNEIDDSFTEKVSRKTLRPSPPPVSDVDNWVPGYHVEVYHNMSWKTATLVKNLDQQIYVVRLLGESVEFEVHRSYLRVRQSWEDGKWFIVGKGAFETSTKKYTNTSSKPSGGKVPKRVSPVSLTNLEADSDLSRRTGVTETNRTQKRLKVCFSDHLFSSEKKVDDCIHTHEKLGENFVHSILDIAKNIFSAPDFDIIESNLFYPTPTRASRRFETKPDVSSVGSCSIDDSTRSECGNGEGSHSSKRNVELLGHRLGLILYRRVLKSLYSSGPLGWEDEMKVVELMDVLHISNDEHLEELKNLMSTAYGILAR